MSSRNRRRRLSRLNPFGRRSAKPAEKLARFSQANPEMMEQLEQRQMLFAHVMGPEGTYTAIFGYTIPYLVPLAPGTANDIVRVEDFAADDPADPGPTANGFPIQSGFIFQESNLRLEHNVALARLVRENLATQGANLIRMSMQDGESFSLSTAYGPEGASRLYSIALRDLPGRPKSMRMDLGPTFDPAGMVVDLVRNGAVVASFTGNALLALSVALPLGRQYVFNPPNGGSFDHIRFTAIAAQSFTLDNVVTVIPPGNFAPMVDSHAKWGASVTFTAPVGATIQFLDLYGREMRDTVELRIPAGAQPGLTVVDADDDGIPDFNDGIGRIIMTGTDSLSTLVVNGVTVEPLQGVIPLGTVRVDPNLVTPAFAAFNIAGSTYDDFESAGYGFTSNPAGTAGSGLPAGPGQVIIGAPWVRPNTNSGTYGALPPQFATAVSATNFNNGLQGIKLLDGSPIDSVTVNGVIHGSSQFNGFMNTFSAAYMMGSLTVQGDLGTFSSATDAGFWVADDGGQFASTNSTLIVGRTLGAFEVAGRSAMSITVLGDLNNPTLHPPRNTTGVFYFEREGNVLFGPGPMGNDKILSAEYIGSSATAVTVVGTIPLVDPGDVYAFVVDGTQDLVIQCDSPGAYLRVMDQDGRTLAATQQSNPIGTNPGFTTIRYRPLMPGAFYLNVMGGGQYQINISGLAPTTFGSFRTGAGLPSNPSVQVLSGDLGMFRVGTGFIDTTTDGRPEADPSTLVNGIDGQDVDTLMGLNGVSLSLPGSLFNVTCGTDIGSLGGLGLNLTLGRNLGNIVTGLWQLQGTNPRQGDFHNSRFEIGGSIGMMDIRGAMGADQDVNPRPPNGYPVGAPNSIIVRTGRQMATNPSLRGDIGFVRVGSDVGEGTLALTTPGGSTVGGFVIDQDLRINSTEPWDGIYSNDPILSSLTGLNLNLGFNSDLRFFDAIQIDLGGVNNKSLPLISGVPLNLTDDGGATVTIVLNGAATNGRIIVMPISGSLGVAIGRIEVNLVGGASLTITGNIGANGADVVTIGNIILTGADAGSAIDINGLAQVDVYRIQQTGGTTFGNISNTSNFGDIVAADVQGLNSLTMGSGSLGRTQMVAWGPQLIGPFLGITGQGGDTGAGTPIVLPPAIIAPLWNGDLFRPVSDTRQIPPGPWLDDLGSPVSPFLNGIIVRQGNVLSVSGNGAIGDVVLDDQQNPPILGTVTANADAFTPVGRFDGLVGVIYADRIASVDIGDGLVPHAPSPMPTSGIFAADDIGQVIGGRAPGAAGQKPFISSYINASNVTPGNTDPNLFPTDGVNLVSLSGGGNIQDAYIGAMKADSYWRGLFTAFDVDPEQYTGNVNQVIGDRANLLRTQVWGDNLNLIQLNNGFYDATVTHFRTNIQTIVAVGFRNSTVAGNQSEFFPNQILSGADIGSPGGIGLITTFNRAGDMDDLQIDALGRIFEVSALNMSRSTIDADLELVLVQTLGDFRSVTVTTGLLTSGLVGRNVQSSSILVAGRLVSLDVQGAVINSHVEVSGPDGSLELLNVRQSFTGSIAVAGPINRIQVIEGDLVARLTTAANLRGVPGNINSISAGRDLDLDADIAGTVTQMVAGRHFGNRTTFRSFVVHGDVFLIDISHGQLYSDIRIEQQLTGSLLVGAVNNKPGTNLLGTGSLFTFGRMNNVVIEGDFGGRIVSYSGGINTVTINNGSLLKGGAVQAFDGDLLGLVINSGHLLGDVHADYILWLVQVNASADGVFGDIGINPALSQGISATSLRNQLPPGVVADSSIQGPRITAGFNLGRVEVNNGSIFEAFIFAGRAIGTITVNGDIRNDTLTSGTGTVIAAGSSIFLVTATGNMSDLIIMGGVRSFGNDGRPGGVSGNADTMQSGRIETITAGGTGTNVIVTAGMNAGGDGVYNTGDETVTLGISYVRTATFTGGVANASVFADSQTITVSPGVVRAGSTFPLADGDLSDGSPVVGGQITPGVPFVFNLPGGIQGSITFTGPGQAYFDATARRVILLNTSLDSTVRVDANGTLTDFDIVTNDDASMGSITVTAPLAGDSDIVVDAYCYLISVGNFSGTGTIKGGMNVRTIITGNFTGGFIQAAFWARDIIINGNFGTTATTGEARIDANAASTITINGTFAALVNIELDLGAFTVNGPITLAQFRAGNSVGSFTSGAMSQSRVSVGDGLGPVFINGTVFESNIQAGGDLGSDAAPGGAGFAADRTSSGAIASVQINGDFTRSSIAAGMLRGPDGYFGTADDSAAAGRSTIGQVTITGTQVGSNLNSESFAIAATGSVAGVTVGGQNITEQGNFKVESLRTKSNPLRVVDVVISQSSLIWFATFYFNQSINASTFMPSLTVSEVRDNGLTLVPLVQGVDYVFEPSVQRDRAVIRFSRAVTDRNLVAVGGTPGPNSSAPGIPAAGVPGPGVFRFTLDADTFRGTVNDARLDSNFSTPESEDYSSDFVVGDAGDKFDAEVINASSDPLSPQLFDMYGPADLDLVLDNNFTPDGQPDANIKYIVRGSIGDHPDHDVNIFRPAADVDIYKITLRAGQILRLGAMQGAAINTPRRLFNSTGVLQNFVTADTYALPNDVTSGTDASRSSNILIKTTGTYFIVLTNNLGFLTPGLLPNLNSSGGTVGEYNFSVEIFDDADTGFGAATDSGNGTNIVDAPQAILFAGNNGVFEPIGDPGSDDLSVVSIGDFRFTLDPGVDGIRGTGDDIVSGSNSQGVTSRRAGTALTSTVFSAIGPSGHTGVPGDVTPDADVFVLNNGQTLQPGTTYTITVKLADIGADLGSFSRFTRQDYRGSVQFGVFDITNATAVDDGALVFSPGDFKSTAQKAKAIAEQGAIKYGYDANGDFFITFVTPGRIGGLATDPAVYAIYIQGVFNTDYSLVVSRTENAPAAVVPQAKQNVLIETRGGEIDWLQAGGLKTALQPFTAGVLGFSGTVGILGVGDYVLQQLVARLNGIFTANGLNVVFSTNPADFEFQDFSRVFVTSTTDPINIFNSGTPNFGYSQHSDPYNSDRNDQAVVFLPSFGQLGFSSGQADVDNFVLSLTAAVGRRAGELMGLRLEANETTANNPNSIMRANSVAQPSINAGYLPALRPLSNLFDSTVETNFFLGQQNAFSLLDKFLTP